MLMHLTQVQKLLFFNMKKTKSYLGFIILSCFIVGLELCLLLINLNKSVVMSIESPTAPMSTPKPVVHSQISPDGTHTVGLSTISDTTEIKVNNEVVSRKPVDPGVELLVPFNTWSPDDKYFFLCEKSEQGDEYLVMTASGKYFVGDLPYLKVKELFTVVHPDLTIVDVTGWAAPTLLIINAKSGNETNMSFWFDVSTHKFIRLSNYFY